MCLLGVPDLRDPDAVRVSLVDRDEIEPTSRHGLRLLELLEYRQQLIAPAGLGAESAVQHEHAVMLDDRSLRTPGPSGRPKEAAERALARRHVYGWGQPALGTPVA